MADNEHYQQALRSLLGATAPGPGVLSGHFTHFFKRINPSPSFELTAASEYATVKRLLEDPNGPAGTLGLKCHLQGSYRQSTAIYFINDVDIVVVTNLIFPPLPGGGSSWSRHQIFETVASALAKHQSYQGKIAYNPDSMCIKLKLGIKLELLPVVKSSQGPSGPEFYLWRPERRRWEAGYAKTHQALLTSKNAATLGNYVPMVKVLKHMRSLHQIDSVSFHIESLLHSLPNSLFVGPPVEYIPRVLNHLAQFPAEHWYTAKLTTPCGERFLHHESEWDWPRWRVFHAAVSVWAAQAELARTAATPTAAIQWWQGILGDGYFPATVNV